MDNRTNIEHLGEKGEVTGVRPGSEVSHHPEKPQTRNVVVRSEEEREEAIINRPKPKNVTPLASQKLTPKDIPVFEDTPERKAKLELRREYSQVTLLRVLQEFWSSSSFRFFCSLRHHSRSLLRTLIL